MQQVDTTNWNRADYIRFYSKIWHVPVIPILPNKKAMVKWAEYQHRLPAKDELEQCKSSWGIAIVCGAIAGNLFSIDIDDPDLFKQLKQAGAFPTGACIYKSARGYHVIMKAKDMIPYPVKEHNPQLEALDALFGEFGISGDRTLSIMPDTPKREWLALYDAPVEVEYEVWLRKYIGYTRDMEKARGEEINMWCPYHNDKREGDPAATPSLYINIDKGIFQCFGCKEKGTIERLIKDSKTMGFDLPELGVSLTRNLPSILRLTDTVEETEAAYIIQYLLEAGENGTMIISGVSGIGKTTLGLSISLPLSMGHTVLGQLLVNRAYKILYINFEQSGQAVLKQAKAMSTYLGQPTDPSQFGILPGMDISIMGENNKRSPGAQGILDRIISEGIEVVVMDSILALVNDPNEQIEVELVLKLQQDIRKAGCAIIWLNHTVTGEGVGTGVELSVGRLGKALARFCATKLVYTGLPEETYVGRLVGSTRGWGKFDQPIAYENISCTAGIIDWREIESEDREGLGKSPLIKELEQGLIFAKKLGKSKTECAEGIGISRTQMYQWLSGEDYPDEESEQKVKQWLSGLRDTLENVRRNHGGKEPDTSLTNQSKSTPKTKKTMTVKKEKKVDPAPSGKSAPSHPDTVKTIIFD